MDRRRHVGSIRLALCESRLEEAAEWYRNALAIEPRNADTWCVLGAISWRQWLQQGKPALQPLRAGAISAFEPSVSLDPLQDVAIQYLSLLLRERAGTPVSSAVVSWEPVVRGAEAARPVRVAPADQARKLITKVTPECTAGAPMEEPMRFVVVISKDGRVIPRL